MACSYTHGNDTYKSGYDVEWVDANVDMLTFTGTVSVYKYPIGTDSGFNASPVIGIERGGDRVAELHFGLFNPGRKEISFEVELDKGGTFSPVANVFGYEGVGGGEVYLYEDSDKVSACSTTYSGELTAEEPPDISSMVVENLTVSSDKNNTVSIVGDVVNEIESGDGEVIERSVDISIDGSDITSVDIRLEPSESRELDLLITNVEPGDREVCIS